MRSFCLFLKKSIADKGGQRACSLAGNSVGTEGSWSWTPALWEHYPVGGRISSPASSDLHSKLPADVSILGCFLRTPNFGQPTRPGVSTPNPASWEPSALQTGTVGHPISSSSWSSFPTGSLAWLHSTIFLPGCSGVTWGSWAVPGACCSSKPPIFL